MDKRESLNIKKPQQKSSTKPAPSGGGSGKISGLSNKTFGLIKFVLGICLLPFVYTSSQAFFKEFGLIGSSFQWAFFGGIISFLLIYLFVWEPLFIYDKGHKVLEAIFQFFKPLVNVAPNLLPIYTIVIFILYSILSVFIREEWLLQYCIFLAGFTLSLHLVFAAKSIRGKKDFLKANYIFGFSLIYILNIMIVAFCFSLIFRGFSFVNFSQDTYFLAKNIFVVVFRQLFSV